MPWLLWLDDFQTFAYHINVLERAATNEGYGLNAFITSLRKLWYNGIALDIIVVGTRNLDEPNQWVSQQFVDHVIARAHDEMGI